MKATLKIEIKFESFFDPEREPKTKEDWAMFMSQNLISDSNLIGELVNLHQDMIFLQSFNVECLNIES